MVTAGYICSATDPKNRWLITVRWSGAPTPSRDFVVFRDGGIEVYSRALAAPREGGGSWRRGWHELVPEPT